MESINPSTVLCSENSGSGRFQYPVKRKRPRLNRVGGALSLNSPPPKTAHNHSTF